MRIYGLDFTSAPSRKKPITCISGNFTNNILQVNHLLKLTSLNEFELFLKRQGPWIAGFDFPFGQPEKLIENLGWPKSWPKYVEQLAAMPQQEFEETLAGYRRPRPSGLEPAAGRAARQTRRPPGRMRPPSAWTLQEATVVGDVVLRWSARPPD